MSITATTSSDTPYLVGRFLGPVAFVAIVWGIGYLGIRIIKKRKPNARETRTIIIIGVVLMILGVIGRAANNHPTGTY